VQGDNFTITIHDNGDSFDPDAITPAENIPGVADPANNLRAGGLGLHFMRKLMDEIHFDLDSEKGNTLVMVKKIKGG
jgi:anti-sigma regulatory factor (Ser/Thr protein kinase)